MSVSRYGKNHFRSRRKNLDFAAGTRRGSFQALRAVYRFERSKVERFELSFEEIYLLQYLRRNSPSRMSAIAREMGIPVSNATRLVGRLYRMQPVDRGRD